MQIIYTSGNRRGRLGLESEREIDEGFGNSRCAFEALDVSTGGRFYENGQSESGGMSDGHSG